MSSDIPIILAHDHGDHLAVFAGAAGLAQMRQYATAGWTAATGPGFAAPPGFDPSQVPAIALSEVPRAVALYSLQVEAWSDAIPVAIDSAAPMIVKVNAAFSADAAAEAARTAAECLSRRGYHLIGAHWRDDNTHRLRSLNRIEPLAALEPPEWKRLDVIGCRDAVLAERILRIGRVHAAQERRVAEFRLAELLRADYIAKLEEALQTLQGASRA